MCTPIELIRLVVSFISKGKLTESLVCLNAIKREKSSHKKVTFVDFPLNPDLEKKNRKVHSQQKLLTLERRI